MSARDDGGPAFARPYGGHPDPAPGDPDMQAQEGMSLHNHFAGLAMQAFLSDPIYRAAFDFSEIAHNAGRMADAMLADGKRRGAAS